VPRSVKEAIKEIRRDRLMRRNVRRAAALAHGDAPPRETLAALGAGWGDDGFRAVGGYLEEVARRAAETRGPVLEVGSGLTTLLLGLLAARRGVDVWTLEHLPEFHRQTRRRLERYGVGGVRLTLAPLRDHGDFSWYDAPLDEMPRDFRLVIADGPPAQTKGGRVGLPPVMRRHLADDCVVLLDDVERESEREVLRRWAEDYGLGHTLAERDGKAWAVCVFDGRGGGRSD
jgi:predicted O-methyltransferase YrrM